MKRYVRSIDNNSIDAWIDVSKLQVTVVYEPVAAVESASTIRPLHDEEGVLSAVALADYDAFILNAIDIFDGHDFDIIQEHESPYSQSYYAAFVKKAQIEDADYKYILFVRLSDHPISVASKRGKQKYYRDLAEQLKQPASKSRQVWKLKEVIVNNQTYESYDEALEALDKSLRQYD